MIFLFLALGIYLEGYFLLIRLILVSGLFSTIYFLNKYVLKENLIIWTCFLIAAFVNIYHLHPIESLGPDRRMWWALAQGQTNDIGWILYRPKLYVWFLSLFDNFNFIPVAHWLLRIATLGILWLICKQLKWHPAVSGFVILLYGLNSMAIQEQSQLMDTTLFSLLVISSFYLFIRAHQTGNLWIWGFGIVTGLCTLTRQVADPFIVFGFLILTIYHKPQWKDISIGALLFLLIGWSGLWVNWLEHNVPKRTVALGVNLFTHSSYYKWESPNINERILIGKITGKINENKKLWNNHFSQPIDWYANSIPHSYQRYLESLGMTRIESDKFLRNQYLHWVNNHRMEFTASIVNELQRLLLRAHEYGPKSMLPSFLINSKTMMRIERSLIHFPVWMLLVFCLFAFITTRQPYNFCPLFICTGYMLMIAAVQVGFTRYTLPMLPILYLSFGYVLESLYKTPIQWKMLEPSKNKSTLLHLHKPMGFSK